MSWSRISSVSETGRSTKHRMGTCWLAAWLVLAGFFLIRATRGTAVESSAATRSAKISELASGGISGPAGRRNTRNIEAIQVGERVITDLPAELRELAVGTETDQPWWDTEDVDPTTWRRIELEVNDGNSRFEIVLLRPDRWIDEREAAVGGSVHLVIPEQGIDGPATVRAIGACPSIRPGRGRVVTGTITHVRGGILDIHVVGQAAPLGVTENHLIYCVNRREFVHAGTLTAGDTLRHLHGESKVQAIQPRQGEERVYNLEIHGEHVYRVTGLGLLVHNTSAPKPVYIDPTRFPEAAKNVSDAQAQGQPRVVTVERTGSTARRRGSTGQNTEPRTIGTDIDEYPPASTMEGGRGAHTRRIPSGDNRGAGGSYGGQIRDVPNGGRIEIIPEPPPES